MLGNLMAVQAAGAVAVVPMGQDLSAEMGKGRKRGKGCQFRNLRGVGRRCFCGGRMKKSSRCR